MQPFQGTTYNHGGVSVNPLRNSTVRWVQDVPGIKDILWPYVWESNRQAYNFDISNIFEVQFTEYSAEEEQHYDWHHDVNFSADSGYDRKLSVVIQLTDPSEYEGGDFEFKETQAPENIRKQGSVLTFPSYLTHRVIPVVAGTRHSLVTWVEGPRWR